MLSCFIHEMCNICIFNVKPTSKQFYSCLMLYAFQDLFRYALQTRGHRQPRKSVLHEECWRPPKRADTRRQMFQPLCILHEVSQVLLGHGLKRNQIKTMAELVWFSFMDYAWKYAWNMHEPYIYKPTSVVCGTMLFSGWIYLHDNNYQI